MLHVKTHRARFCRVIMRTSARVLVLVGVALALVVLLCGRADAGTRFIAPLIPDPDRGIKGLTFDGGPNPLVIDGTTWRLLRLDVETGAVLGSTVPNNPGPGTRSLVHDRVTGHYYTESFRRPARISADMGSAVLLPNSWPLFNFQCMAQNPVDGSLWLATDNSRGQLWRVDPTTGAVSLHRTFGVFHPSGGGISALAIDAGGNFFVTGALELNDQENVFAIHPDTGAVQLITSLDFSSDFIVDFDYSPVTGRWYGVKEVRSATPRRWEFVEITGIPEPAVVPAACGLVALLIRRRRRAGKA